MTARKSGSETFADRTAEATISSGRVADGNRLKKFKDEVRYGNDVVLGALAVEFEGEDVLMEDLTFKVELEAVSMDSPLLTTHGYLLMKTPFVLTVFVYGLMARTSPTPMTVLTLTSQVRRTTLTMSLTLMTSGLTVDFDGSFTIDVRKDREVIFEIVADLDEAWSHFDGTEVEFTLVNVDTAEGVNSDRDYRATGEYFATERKFKDVTLQGNEITFAINHDGMDGTSFVRGSDDIVFGTLEIDAKNAIDDIEVRDLYVSFQIPAGASTVGDLSELNDCRVLDASGDEIADSRGITGEKEATDPSTAVTDQARFRFDDYVVEAGDRERVDIVCDIDDGAEAGDKYKIVVNTAANDLVKYRIGRHEDEYDLERR